MFIDFTGYAGDCLITAKLDLRAPRLTDQLNADPLVQLVEVTLEDLVNGHRIETPEFTIERTQLCAVRATGPRGSRALRIATAPHRLRAQIGPYTVLGRLHEPPGTEALATFSQRDLMVPVTDATIAYLVGDILDVRDWTTLVINRELASWYRAVDGDEALGSGPPARPGAARPGAPSPVDLVGVGSGSPKSASQVADRTRRQAGPAARGAKSR